MKKIVSILVLVFLALFVNTALANTYYVSPVGSNSNNGSIGNPWLTITYAISQVSSGDIINVEAGIYIENITVNKSITLNGAGQNNTTIYPAISDVGDPNGPSFGNSQIIVVSANNVTISNLKIDGHNPSFRADPL